MSTPLTTGEIVRLNSTHVDLLNRAARESGVAFRNGALTKQQLIQRLLNSPSIGRATLARIEVLRASGEHIPPVKPPAPAMDWDDDQPAPIQAPAPAPIGQIPDDLHDGLQALRQDIATRLPIVDHRATVRQWESAIDSLTARIDAIEKQRPIEIPLGNGLPPMQFEGITHERMPSLIRALRIGEGQPDQRQADPVFLIGPASSGKTTAAMQCAEYLSKLFNRDDYIVESTGAINGAHELLGYIDAMGRYVETPFRRAVEHGHLFIWDEIDGSGAECTLVINALDNGFIAFPDRKIPVHPHFRMIGGGNTDGSSPTMQYSGRTRLDGAFLDRFLMIDWELDPRIEEQLSRGNAAWLKAVQAIRQFSREREILDVVATARATRRGPQLLAQGETPLNVLEMTCKRGALRDCWSDILALPAVRAFLK